MPIETHKNNPDEWHNAADKQEILKLKQEASAMRDEISTLKNRILSNQAVSAATDIADIVSDFNSLLSKLKAAGIMEADEANT